MRSDIVPGAIFPGYELSDHTAKRRKLSELQGQDPMVLILSRGGYCPKDRRQHEGLVQLGYWGATGQKSSIRKMSSDFPRRRRCVRQMVIFDVARRDFKVVKQSAIQGNTGGWQSNFSRSSNAAPMVALMANRQLINWRATFTSMISIGRLLRSTAEITIV
jgi:hypothetical protein